MAADNLSADRSVINTETPDNRQDGTVVTKVKRGAGLAMLLGVAAAISALGFSVATAADRLDDTAALAAAASAAESPAEAATAPGGLSAAPALPQAVLPATAPLQPKPALLERGDTGPRVRDLQARLRQLAWLSGDVTDDFDGRTRAAVAGFQAKRGLPELGYVDRATLRRLRSMTTAPTADELANRFPSGITTDAPLDSRCLRGRALCVDKSSRTLRWVVDGTVRRTFEVRFGASYSPTREGLFHVGWKSRDHVSSLYDSPMPFAMFFSGGQAVHYSSDFAATGYNGASHGCVNVRDYDGIAWLFDQVQIGDKVVVYWS